MSSTTIPAEMTGGLSQVNPWVIGVVVSMAAFMEVLDTSIANVALPHIAGFDPHSAQQGALAQMYGILNTQAQALSYLEVYWLLALISIVMFFLCFFWRGTSPVGPARFKRTDALSICLELSART